MNLQTGDDIKDLKEYKYNTKLYSVSYSCNVYLITLFIGPIPLSLFALIGGKLDARTMETVGAITLGASLFSVLFTLPSFLIFTVVAYYIIKSLMSIRDKKISLGIVSCLLIWMTALLLYKSFEMFAIVYAVSFCCVSIIAIWLLKLNPKIKIENSDDTKLKQRTAP